MRIVLSVCLLAISSVCWGQHCPKCGRTIVTYPTETVISSVPSQVGSPISTSASGEVIISSGPVETVTSTNPVVSSTGAPMQTVSYASSVPSTGTVSYAPYSNALTVVNQKRRRAGLRELIMDPVLTATAQRKSAYRSARRITGHDGSSKAGARVEGVGYAYGQGNSLERFNTCYLYSNGYTYAGAAVAHDSSGRAYYTLLLR